MVDGYIAEVSFSVLLTYVERKGKLDDEGLLCMDGEFYHHGEVGLDGFSSPCYTTSLLR